MDFYFSKRFQLTPKELLGIDLLMSSAGFHKLNS